jgi:PAS domain S-box-containing protein
VDELSLAETFARILREVIRAPSRAALLEGACRVAVGAGQLRLAWVAWLDGDRVVPVARAGHDEGYVDEVSFTLSGRMAEGPTGRALLSAQVQHCDDFATDPRMEPWRDAASRRGLVSSASLPLRLRGEVVGTLNLYSGERAFFRGPARGLLEELADDISFTLDHLEDAAERERMRDDYRALFEQAADGIFIADASGRYVNVNAAGVRLLGYSLEELRALTVRDLIAPESLEARPLNLRALATHSTTVNQRRLKRRDGTTVDVEIAATRLSNGTVQGIVRDLTERNRLLTELVQTDRLASMGQLAAGIAHEINNPLAYVMLNLTLLQQQLEGTTSATALESAAVAREALGGVERVADLVRDLRMLTQANHEAMSAVDARSVAERALRITGHQLRRVARVETDFTRVAPVHATPARLEQVLINLLVNAAQAITPGDPERQRITVRLFEREGQGVLEVSDTGCGIPPEVQPHLFEPFFTTRVNEGTGLGLPISRGIVASFGGRLTFETEPGRGTTFRVELPLAPSSAAPETPASAPRPVALSGLRLLVVDDEAGIRDALVRLVPGCVVDVATDGVEALAALEQAPYDVVLTDLLMPRLSGRELFAQLEARWPRLARRVVFMTGAITDEATRRFVAQTENPLLEKPFRLEALELAVQAALTR